MADYDLITLEGKMKRRISPYYRRSFSRMELLRNFDLGFTSDDLDETDFSGLKKAVKKAKKAAKKTPSAVKRTTTKAVKKTTAKVKTQAQRAVSQAKTQAQRAVTQAKTQAQRAVTQAKTQAQHTAVKKIAAMKEKIKSIPQAAKQEAVSIVRDAATNLKNYPKLTAQRMKNYVHQTLTNPDVMLQIASQADIPIVSGVIKSYMDVNNMMQQGMTLEDIAAQNPELAEFLQNPDAQAYLAVMQNPSAEIVAAVQNDVSPGTVNNLQNLLQQVQTILQANAPAIVARAFSIFDLVDEGKLE